MDITKLNKALKDLENIKLKKVSSFQPEDYFDEKNDGRESERVDIYDLEQDGLFLKVITISNSYGDEQGVRSIQIVKPIEKQITDYESI